MLSTGQNLEPSQGVHMVVEVAGVRRRKTGI
jgi:hypothetical protein